MAADKFRRQLRQEMDQWRKDGLIDTTVYEALAQRYRIAGLEQEASNSFIMILLGLGAVLLGLGVITFVAANWQGWTRLFKVAVLLGGFIGTGVTGFYLWRSPRTSPSRWGHALLLLSMLILGANLGLLPQMFHQSGPVYVLFLVWGFCVALMAYGLRLTSLAILSLILLVCGYGSGFNGFWGYGSHEGFWAAIVQFMPLVLIGLFLPLAYWCRSRVLFGLGAIALVMSFNSNLLGNGYLLPNWFVGSFIFLCPALLWVYDRQSWQLTGVWRDRRSSRPEGQISPVQHPPFLDGSSTDLPFALNHSFRQISRVIALILLGINLYGFAFHGLWRPPLGNDSGTANGLRNLWPILLQAPLLLVVAKLGWMSLMRQFPGFRRFQLRALNSGMVALLITIPVALYLVHQVFVPLPLVGPWILNILLGLMAIALIRDGLAGGNRSCFWGGMVLLVVDILTRMFEYDTGLMLKALVFVLCGIGVLIAGIGFERKAQRPPLPDSLGSAIAS